MNFGLAVLWRLVPRRNVAEEPERMGFMAPFLLLTGECQRPLGEGLRLLQAAGQLLRLPQGEMAGHLEVYSSHHNHLFHRLPKQGHGVGDAPAQIVRRSQGRRYPREISWEVRLVTDTYGAFKKGKRPGKIALAEG